MNSVTFKKRCLLLGVSVLAAVFLACGVSATPTPVPTAAPTPASVTSEELTAAEAEYIEQVRVGWNEFHSEAGGFRQAFNQTYSMKSRLFEALIDAGAGSAFEGAYQAVKQIKPPPPFQADHELMLQAMATMVGYDHDVGKAAENQDLVGFTVADTRMAGTAGQMGLRLSDAVCQATVAPDFPFSLCDPSRTLPGGEYGAMLNSALARFDVSLITSLFQIGPHHTDEDLLGMLEVLEPERIDLYSRTRDEISGFSPPADLAAGHDQLIKYLEALLDIGRLRNSAVQAQDLDKYQEERGKSRKLYCQARQQFVSGEMKELVRVHFVDVFEICGTKDY